MFSEPRERFCSALHDSTREERKLCRATKEYAYVSLMLILMAARGASHQRRILGQVEPVLIANGADMARALAESDGEELLLVNDVTIMADADWSRYSLPVLITRNVTMRGTPDRWAFLQVNHLQSKLKLARSVTFRLMYMVISEFFDELNSGGSADLVVPNLPNETATLKMEHGAMIYDVCYPPELASAYLGINQRPSSIPGQNQITTTATLVLDGNVPAAGGARQAAAGSTAGAAGCVADPAAPPLLRCWDHIAYSADYATPGRYLDARRQLLPTYYFIHLVDAYVLCTTTLNQSCIRAYQAFGCMALVQEQLQEARRAAREAAPPAQLSGQVPEGAGGGDGGGALAGSEAGSGGGGGGGGRWSAGMAAGVGVAVGVAVVMGLVALVMVLLVRRRRRLQVGGCGARGCLALPLPPKAAAEQRTSSSEGDTDHCSGSNPHNVKGRNSSSEPIKGRNSSSEPIKGRNSSSQPLKLVLTDLQGTDGDVDGCSTGVIEGLLMPPGDCPNVAKAAVGVVVGEKAAAAGGSSSQGDFWTPVNGAPPRGLNAAAAAAGGPCACGARPPPLRVSPKNQAALLGLCCRPHPVAPAAAVVQAPGWQHGQGACEQQQQQQQKVGCAAASVPPTSLAPHAPPAAAPPAVGCGGPEGRGQVHTAAEAAAAAAAAVAAAAAACLHPQPQPANHHHLHIHHQHHQHNEQQPGHQRPPPPSGLWSGQGAPGSERGAESGPCLGGRDSRDQQSTQQRGTEVQNRPSPGTQHRAQPRTPHDPHVVISCLTPLRPDLEVRADMTQVVKLLPVVRGKGSYGKVYEGLYGGVHVAVKLMARDLFVGDQMVAGAAGGALLKSFAQEVEVLGRCCHPNVVRLLAACLTPPRLCLVMELMETSLQRLVFGGGGCGELMPLAKVLHVATEVARGLEYLHPTIVHRDLKPDNILLKRADAMDPIVKVSDFGLSRLRSTVAPTTHPEAGTPAYMAPECFDVYVDRITHHVDVYSWAVVVWALMTGLEPWQGCSVVEIAYRVTLLGERLPPVNAVVPGRCPRRLQRLLEECWNRVPERRPAAAEVVKQMLLIIQHPSEHSDPDGGPGNSVGGVGGSTRSVLSRIQGYVAAAAAKKAAAAASPMAGADAAAAAAGAEPADPASAATCSTTAALPTAPTPRLAMAAAAAAPAAVAGSVQFRDQVESGRGGGVAGSAAAAGTVAVRRIPVWSPVCLSDLAAAAAAKRFGSLPQVSIAREDSGVSFEDEDDEDEAPGSFVTTTLIWQSAPSSSLGGGAATAPVTVEGD